MTVRLYADNFDKEDKKEAFKKAQEERLNEFLEMEIHERKTICYDVTIEITLMRVLGGFMYITRMSNSKSVTTNFISENEINKKIKIEE